VNSRRRAVKLRIPAGYAARQRKANQSYPALFRRDDGCPRAVKLKELLVAFLVHLSSGLRSFRCNSETTAVVRFCASSSSALSSDDRGVFAVLLNEDLRISANRP
jgi:hypothetical protein